ncbi:MAG: hypothetical protein AAF191_05710 [Verrucomicrobiota bacterium]
MRPYSWIFGLGLALVCLPSLLAERASLLGTWVFDSDRKEVYMNSLGGFSGEPMAEISASMGMGRLENVSFELGKSKDGPFFARIDKNTNRTDKELVTIKRVGRELHLYGLRTGSRYRLQPITPSTVNLVSESDNVTIPLKKLY